MSNKADLFNQVKIKTERLEKSEDKGIINNGKNSVSIKKDGTNSSIAGEYAQSKIDKESGTITNISLQDSTYTVQKDIVANDISINKHKLNSQLYELTNFKQVKNTSMGGLTIQSYVLVKVWEPTLQKHVLIRRQIRVPLFSYLLDTFKTHEQLEMDIDMENEILQYKINKDGDNKDA